MYLRKLHLRSESFWLKKSSPCWGCSGSHPKQPLPWHIRSFSLWLLPGWHQPVQTLISRVSLDANVLGLQLCDPTTLAQCSCSFPTIRQLLYMIKTFTWPPLSRSIFLWSSSQFLFGRLFYILICLRKLWGWCNCIPLLVVLVFFTCLVDTSVNTGHENTDGFLDGRL